MSSQWKPILGFQDYEVSDLGMVRSNDRVVNISDGRKRKVKGKYFKPRRKPDGYLFVSLSKNGFTTNFYVHRLVATAFLPNPGALPEVNHLSGDKTDNRVGNLEWVSHRDNVIHAYDTGLSSNQGGSHYFAVGVIDNELGKEFGTIKEWTDARGIVYSTGRNIINGQKSRQIDLVGITVLRRNMKTKEGVELIERPKSLS